MESVIAKNTKCNTMANEMILEQIASEISKERGFVPSESIGVNTIEEGITIQKAKQ